MWLQQDELMWAATWLFLATNNPKYLDFVKHHTHSAAVCEFNWDLKFVGSQVLLTKVCLLLNYGPFSFLSAKRKTKKLVFKTFSCSLKETRI